MDALLLSRLQFAWVIALHILLPAFTVGLAAYIAVLEGIYFFTRRAVFLSLSRFWLRLFAISFGMGVASGIVMPFQFGTNWSRFSDVTADVLGPLMGYEVLMAFFLEACFLGVLLFGRDRVPHWVHFLAAVMVAAGTLLSTFWILSANSWMQTPAGHAIVDGRFVPQDWLQVVFNPSFPYRLVHTTMAFFITTALVVIGVAAYHLRRARHVEESLVMQKMGLGLLAVLVPLQILVGDLHGLNTLEHQPAKLAAMEANWETQARMPLLLFAWPDEAAERNHLELGVPVLGSIILGHSPDAVVRGLKDWKAEDRPPVAIPFFAFRLMVGVGVLMLILTIAGLVLWRRGRLAAAAGFHRSCPAARPARRRGGLPACVPARRAARFRGCDRRLGHHGSRAPALGGVRARAHARRGDAVARHARRRDLAPRLRRRLSRHLRRRPSFHGPAGAPRLRAASGARARCSAGNAGAAALGRDPGALGPRWRSIWFRCGLRSSPSRSSCTCCSTASTLASASSSRSRPTTRAATR